MEMWINKGMEQIIENPARKAGRFKFSNVKDSTHKYHNVLLAELNQRNYDTSRSAASRRRKNDWGAAFSAKHKQRSCLDLASMTSVIRPRQLELIFTLTTA
jgi:hypothetical protein